MRLVSLRCTNCVVDVERYMCSKRLLDEYTRYQASTLPGPDAHGKEDAAQFSHVDTPNTSSIVFVLASTSAKERAPTDVPVAIEEAHCQHTFSTFPTALLTHDYKVGLTDTSHNWHQSSRSPQAVLIASPDDQLQTFVLNRPQENNAQPCVRIKCDMMTIVTNRDCAIDNSDRLIVKRSDS